ncbi:hypothetical protein [Deinococcus sp. UYEF24]
MHHITDLDNARQTHTNILPSGTVLTFLNMPVRMNIAQPSKPQLRPDPLAQPQLASKALQAEELAADAHRSLE